MTTTNSRAAVMPTPVMSEADALRLLAASLPAPSTAMDAGSNLLSNIPQDIIEYAHTRFYIPDLESDTPTGTIQAPGTIRLYQHQAAILRYMLDPANNFETCIYSTIKKSGKTAIASLVARWVAETWGYKNEVFACANDEEQARGRIYDKLITSIELDPQYNAKDREKAWKIIQRDATFLPNGTVVRALSGDYKGEAGSNPTATFWSELWGFTSAASRRLWEELTPVPTRKRSLRWVETYAGFEDESDLLFDLYKMGREGRQLTLDDIPDWPYDGPIPIWIRPDARLCMYWDSGTDARRMPWQDDKYYATQATTLRPMQFERLHGNIWHSSTSAFLPVAWWHACRGPNVNVPPSQATVVAVDASITGDCTAILAVCRHPEYPDDVLVRSYQVWQPTQGHPMDYSIVKAAIKDYCKAYNVVEVAYDEYQLHQMMMELSKEGVAWCRKFSQGSQREVADKQLYDMVRDRKIHHTFPQGSEIEQHIQNASSQDSLASKERMRIIKKSATAHVDLVVDMSMAVSECMRLLL